MAVQVKVTMQQEKKILSAWKLLPEAITRELMKATQQAGLFGVGEVKYHISAGTEMWEVPLHTGALRRGIHVAEKKPLDVTIRYSDITPYASYVHEGTSKIPARPFFDITARRSKDKIQDFFKLAVDSAIKRTIGL